MFDSCEQSLHYNDAGALAVKDEYSGDTMVTVSCTLNSHTDFICTETNGISCDRRLVLGVRCRTYNENVGLEINRTISALNQNCKPSSGQMITNSINDSNSSSEMIVEDSTTSSEMTVKESTTSSEMIVSHQNVLQSQVSNERVEDCVSTPVLGGVVGVLVTVLVVLVIGWSLSCVVLVKRNSQTQKETE